MTTSKNKTRDATIAAIAREVLHVETFEARKMDGLDFHDLAVWSVREALERAYAAGFEAATKKGNRP